MPERTVPSIWLKKFANFVSSFPLTMSNTISVTMEIPKCNSCPVPWAFGYSSCPVIKKILDIPERSPNNGKMESVRQGFHFCFTYISWPFLHRQVPNPADGWGFLDNQPRMTGPFSCCPARFWPSPYPAGGTVSAFYQSFQGSHHQKLPVLHGRGYFFD